MATTREAREARRRRMKVMYLPGGQQQWVGGHSGSGRSRGWV